MYIFYSSRNKTDACLPLPPTKLDYLDITLLLHGTMHYAVNGEEIVLHAGDTIIFVPGDTRERIAGGSAEYMSINAEITPEDNLPPIRGVLYGCIGDEIRTLVQLLEDCRRSETAMTVQKSIFYLSALCCVLYEKQIFSVPNRHVTQMKQYIAAHMGESLTLTQISRAVYLSPNYCNRIFRRYTGESISGYIIRTRIEEAKRMIVRRVPLSEISSALGYRDYCYFSHQFRKLTGQSPAEYRHRYAENERAAQWHDT